MKLRHISIHDFKSIHRASLSTHAFNAIIGLNGTGKSNILDAILFCLNRGSVAMMRADCYRGLVRDTCATCRVELVFDGLAVCREVLRDGRARYVLNGHPASNGAVAAALARLNVLVVQQGSIMQYIGTDLHAFVNYCCGTISTYQQRLKGVAEKEARLEHARKQLHGKVSPFFDRMRHERENMVVNRRNMLRRQRAEECVRVLVDMKRLLHLFHMHCMNEEMKSIKERVRRIDSVDYEKMRMERVRRHELRQELARLCEREVVAVPVLPYPVVRTDELRYMLGMLEGPHDIVGMAEERHRLQQDILLCTRKYAGNDIDNGSRNDDIDNNSNNDNSNNDNSNNINIISNTDTITDSNMNIVSNTDILNGMMVRDIADAFGSTSALTDISRRITATIARMTSLSRLLTNALAVIDSHRHTNHALLRTEGRIHELFTYKDEKYRCAIDTILGGKRNYFVVTDSSTASHIMPILHGTFIPLDRITYAENRHTGHLLIDTIAYDRRNARAFRHLLNNYYVFEDEEAARTFSFANRAVTVTLSGTVYDYRGVVSGGMVSVVDMAGRRDMLDSIRRITDCLTAIADSNNSNDSIINGNGISECISRCISSINGCINDSNTTNNDNNNSNRCISNGNTTNNRCISNGNSNNSSGVSRAIRDTRSTVSNMHSILSSTLTDIKRVNDMIAQLIAINNVIDNANMDRIKEVRHELLVEKGKEERNRQVRAEIERIERENEMIRESNERVRKRRMEIENEMGRYEDEKDDYDVRYELKSRLCRLERMVDEDGIDEKMKEIVRKYDSNINNSNNSNINNNSNSNSNINSNRNSIRDSIINSNINDTINTTTTDKDKDVKEVCSTIISAISGSTNYYDTIAVINSRLAITSVTDMISNAICRYSNEIKELPCARREMASSNYDTMMKYEQELCEIKEKMCRIDSDKKKIMRSIEEYEKESAQKREAFVRHVNQAVNGILHMFIRECVVSISNMAVRVCMNGRLVSNDELSGGQRSLIGICMILSCISGSTLCLFDEIDSALDMAQTERVGEYLRERDCQVVVASLKEGFYGCADVIYQVYKEGNYGKVERMK